LRGGGKEGGTGGSGNGGKGKVEEGMHSLEQKFTTAPLTLSTFDRRWVVTPSMLTDLSQRTKR